MSKSSLTSRSLGSNGSSRVTPPPSAECLDLAERFGRRYRIECEESYFAQYVPRARVNDPWLKVISCRAGHIFPWGESTLAAATDKAGSVARKLADLPGATVRQDGSDGITVTFDVADFPQVAKLMRPRRARQLSLTAAQRAEIGRRLARGRKLAQKPIVEIAP